MVIVKYSRKKQKFTKVNIRCIILKDACFCSISKKGAGALVYQNFQQNDKKRPDNLCLQKIYIKKKTDKKKRKKLV